MEFKVCKSIEFDAAHRLLNYVGKCSNLHGHRYKVEFEFRGNPDVHGLVVDFSVIDRIAKDWIDKFWDHNVLLHKDDPLLAHLNFQDTICVKPFSCDSNPTAEYMAFYLYHEISKLSVQAKLVAYLARVRVYETPTCYAEFGV